MRVLSVVEPVRVASCSLNIANSPSWVSNEADYDRGVQRLTDAANSGKVYSSLEDWATDTDIGNNKVSATCESFQGSIFLNFYRSSQSDSWWTFWKCEASWNRFESRDSDWTVMLTKKGAFRCVVFPAPDSESTFRGGLLSDILTSSLIVLLRSSIINYSLQLLTKQCVF